MTWCIHNACKIRDKAQRPSAFKPQPSGRLTCSTPELGAQVQPHRETKKRKWPNLESMSCSLHMVTCHVKMSSSVLSWASLKNGCCRGFQLCRTWWKWKRRCPVLRQAVSTLTRPTGVKPEKWTAVSLYLDELLIQKCKFRDRFTVNC